jgi:hypothetical protein
MTKTSAILTVLVTPFYPLYGDRRRDVHGTNGLGKRQPGISEVADAEQTALDDLEKKSRRSTAAKRRWRAIAADSLAITAPTRDVANWRELTQLIDEPHCRADRSRSEESRRSRTGKHLRDG